VGGVWVVCGWCAGGTCAGPAQDLHRTCTPPAHRLHTTLLIPLPLANSASCFCFFGSAHFLRAGLAAKAGGRPA